MHAPDADAPLNQMRNWQARIGVVLGSGLNNLVSDRDDAVAIPYSSFPELPKISVPGHVGQFVLGKIGKAKVVFAQGRVHLYEGRSAREITGFVRVLAEAGIEILILTNAAGSLNPSFAPGDWMMIGDHLNLTGTSPLIGNPDFIDMTETYSTRLRGVFAAAATSSKIKLHEGVYAGLLGPQYETPAEVRMLRKLGADAVGMSTVLEAIQAKTLGLEVAGFSCITNLAAGISPTKLSHEEVLHTGRAAGETLSRLLATVIPTLCE